VPGASVTLLERVRADGADVDQPSARLIASAISDPGGRATLVAYFDAGGSSKLFWRTGRIGGFGRRWIDVKRQGYDSVQVQLSTFTGTERSLRATRDVSVHVQLRRHSD
jgi:hypothetical protein